MDYRKELWEFLLDSAAWIFCITVWGLVFTVLMLAIIVRILIEPLRW